MTTGDATSRPRFENGGGRIIPSNRTYEPTAPKKKCLLVAEHLSHYREGVYRLLDDSPDWDFVFVGGPETRDGSIPGVPAGALKNQITVRNLWIADRMLWQPGLLRLCLAGKHDAAILVGNAKFLSTWVVAALMRLRGTKVYFWTMGWRRPDANRLKRAARKAFYRLADKLLLYGQDGYEMAVEAGLPSTRMTVIGNSYTQVRPSSAAHQGTHFDIASLDGQMRFVGAVARLTPEKRFDMLIRAVESLRVEGTDVGVILVGAGPADEELATLATALQVPLFLTGAVHSEATLAEIYERIAVTVIPEYAGLTVVQSLDHGTPVVTAADPTIQGPEFRAVQPDVTGLLYSRGSVPRLADAISACLDMVDVRGDQLVEACKHEVTQNWSIESHAERILQALNE